MDIFEVITGRRSIRKYKDAPVEREKIKQLLNLARLAPSALGIPQGFRVVGLTPLGYPDQEPKPRPRKELAEVAFLDVWGAPC